jgi:hypothetical protein
MAEYDALLPPMLESEFDAKLTAERKRALDDAWQACKEVWDKYDCKTGRTSHNIAAARGAQACMAAVHALKR